MRVFSRVRRDIGVAIGAIAAAATSAACVAPFACTLIGWDEGLTIDLVPSGDVLVAGRYDIEVVADGEPLVIAVDLAEMSYTCLPPEDDCFVELALEDGRDLWLRFDYQRLIVSYGNEGGPAEAIVTVRRDGAVVGSDVFTPTYQRTEPNGRGCGVATTARVDLPID